MDMTLSPNGKYVLASTDKGRLIVFDLKGKFRAVIFLSVSHAACIFLIRNTGAILKNFFGAVHDQFGSPRNAWHPSGLYVYSNSQVCLALLRGYTAALN